MSDKRCATVSRDNGLAANRRQAIIRTNNFTGIPLQWRHNGPDSVSNQQPHDCFLNRLFRRISKETSKLRVTGLCAGNSPGTGELPAQMASYAENVSIWWRHHVYAALGLDKLTWYTSYEIQYFLFHELYITTLNTAWILQDCDLWSATELLALFSSFSNLVDGKVVCWIESYGLFN